MGDSDDFSCAEFVAYLYGVHHDWTRETTTRIFGPDPVPGTEVPPETSWGDGTDLIAGSPDVGDIGWKPYE